MVELLPVTWSNLVKRLRLLGFDGPFQGGKHPYMIKESLVLTIPNQHNKDIGSTFSHFKAGPDFQSREDKK